MKDANNLYHTYMYDTEKQQSLKSLWCCFFCQYNLLLLLLKCIFCVLLFFITTEYVPYGDKCMEMFYPCSVLHSILSVCLSKFLFVSDPLSTNKQTEMTVVSHC